MTENEQPYEIPDDWQWIELKNICEYIRAGADKPQDFSPDKTELYTIPVVANSVQNQGIIGYTSMATEKANTVTVSARGTIGYAVLRKYDYYPIVRLIVIAVNDSANPAYIKYVFDFFKEDGIGSVIPQLTIPKLKNKLIPLPPVDEQRRIAACIERLFDKLDRAKALAQKIVDGYELRRGKIFHNAFSGKLTNSDIDGWQKLELGELSDIVGGGTPSTKNEEYYKNGNIPWIRPADLSNYPRKYISSGSQNITELGLKNSAARLIPKNSVCLSTRAPIGYVVIAENPLSTSQGFKNFLPSPIYYPEYLYWYFKGNRKLLEMNAHGTTFLELSKRRLSEIEILLPTIGEQREIAERLDSLLSKELRVKELAEKVLRNIVMMKKKILGMAFRGDL